MAADATPCSRSWALAALAVIACHNEPGDLRVSRTYSGACAVHACELIARRLGVPPRVLDTWLWNRGQEPRYKAVPRHRCRTTWY